MAWGGRRRDRSIGLYPTREEARRRPSDPRASPRPQPRLRLAVWQSDCCRAVTCETVNGIATIASKAAAVIGDADHHDDVVDFHSLTNRCAYYVLISTEN